MLDPSSVREMLSGRRLYDTSRRQRISSIFLIFVKCTISFGEQFLWLDASPVFCPSHCEKDWHLLAVEVHRNWLKTPQHRRHRPSLAFRQYQHELVAAQPCCGVRLANYRGQMPGEGL